MRKDLSGFRTLCFFVEKNQLASRGLGEVFMCGLEGALIMRVWSFDLLQIPRESRA